MTEPKFKVGDWVMCIRNPQDSSSGGSGWKKDLVFEIIKVIETRLGNCYFGGEGGHGVFEGWLVRQDYTQLKIE